MNRFRKTMLSIVVACGIAACGASRAHAQLWLEFAHPNEPHRQGSTLPEFVFEELFADLDASIQVRMVVMLMEFPDDPVQEPITHTTAYYQQMFFGDDFDNGETTVQENYFQTSNGRISVVPAVESHGTPNDGVIGWVTAPNNVDTYDGLEKRAEAIVLADAFMDFAQFDSNSDTEITAHELIFVLINPGDGVGGVTVPTDPATVSVDGGAIDVTIPVGALSEDGESIPHAHETGHPYLGYGDVYLKCDPDEPENWEIGDGYICNILSDSCGTPGEGGDNMECDCPRALNPTPNVILGGSNSGNPAGMGGACGGATPTNGATAWYEVYGNGNTFSASTCIAGTNFDTQISVFCNGCDGLTCVDGNDDAGGCGTSSQVSWCTTPNASYLIAVHGGGGDEGSFQLSISDSGVPCANAADCGLAARHSRHWYPYSPQFATVMAETSNSQDDTVVSLDPWGKIHLGFTKPKVITHDGTYTVHAVEPVRSFNEQDTEPEAYIIYDPQPLSENGFVEYFIVEARNDPDIEDSGLAIWLINERRNLPGTTESNIRRVPRLVHRGGHDPGTSNFLWDSNDGAYYDFGPESTPRNSAWTDGTPSFVEIYDISGAGDTMTFSVRIPPIHVDFSNNSGTETGSAAFPFKFLTGGVNLILEPPRSIRIAGGNYPEALTISTPCTIAHWKGGSAVVGQ